jgi:lysozyme
VVLTYQFNQFLTAVVAALLWVDAIDEVRLGVLAQLAYNLGVAGLLGFHQMLAHLEAGEWAAASLQLKASTADHQEPARIARWAETLATGVAWQPAAASA